MRVVILVIGIMLCFDIIYSFPDTTGSNIKKYIKLNNDASYDTLLLSKSSIHNLVPYKIYWGGGTSHTQFNYPNWNKMNGSINMDDFNKDSLLDLHITIWGKIPITDSTSRDTVASFIIFGQSGLDTLSQIDLTASLDSNSDKFVFVKLTQGYQLVDEAVREYSYTYSYRLPDISLGMPTPPMMTSVKDEELLLKLFPNPTSNLIQLQINTTFSGQAKIKIIDLKGQVFLDKSIILEELKKSDYTLELTNLSNGTYIVTLESDNNKLHLYKNFTILK